MIDIPKLPTPNLYMFAAFCGLLLVGGSGYLLAHMSIEMSKSARDTGHSCESITERETQICEQACDLGIPWSDVQTHSESYFKDPEKKAVLQKWREVRRDWQQVKSDYDYVDWLNRMYKLSCLLCFTGIGVGFWSSSWGFRNWYQRVQVHEDRVKAAKATETSPTEVTPGAEKTTEES